MDLHPYGPHLLSGVSQIWYRASAHDAVDRLVCEFLENLGQEGGGGALYFFMGVTKTACTRLTF